MELLPGPKECLDFMISPAWCSWDVWKFHFGSHFCSLFISHPPALGIVRALLEVSFSLMDFTALVQTFLTGPLWAN